MCTKSVNRITCISTRASWRLLEQRTVVPITQVSINREEQQRSRVEARWCCWFSSRCCREAFLHRLNINRPALQPQAGSLQSMLPPDRCWGSWCVTVELFQKHAVQTSWDENPHERLSETGAEAWPPYCSRWRWKHVAGSCRSQLQAFQTQQNSDLHTSRPWNVSLLLPFVRMVQRSLQGRRTSAHGRLLGTYSAGKP